LFHEPRKRSREHTGKEKFCPPLSQVKKESFHLWAPEEQQNIREERAASMLGWEGTQIVLLGFFGVPYLLAGLSTIFYQVA
jgi:hypothetical protein